MADFWFYTELGFFHVLDINGYDHVLFLMALALPFLFKQWKQVVWLATLFTITHCIALALAVYGIVDIPAQWVEFLIPITIFITAMVNVVYSFKNKGVRQIMKIHLWTTGFFGLIHGLGFSNYFRMLMAGETEKTTSLLGFALGIEGAQLLIILVVLILNYIMRDLLKLPGKYYVGVASLLVVLITLPLIYGAIPG